MDYKLLLSGLGAIGTSIVVLNVNQAMLIEAKAPTPTVTPTIYEEVVVELPAEEVVEEKVVVTKAKPAPKVETKVDATSGGSSDDDEHEEEDEEEEEDDESDED